MARKQPDVLRRVSLAMSEELYTAYASEVLRRKLTKKDTKASLNKLLNEAMEAYIALVGQLQKDQGG